MDGYDAKLSPTLLLDVVREQREHLDVAGITQLTGAKLRAGQGKVELGGSEVQLASLGGRDYRADVSINASTGPVELLTNVVDELTRPRSEQAKTDEHGNVGVIRTGGHDRQQSLAAAVEQRQ